MSNQWPNKSAIELTDEELDALIERHRTDPDPVNQLLVSGCIREWERRRDLPQT